MRPAWIALLAAVVVCCALPLSAQPVLSAKSGVIALAEGKVYLGDQLLEPSLTRFPEIKENGVVRTLEGRAEILLTPGVFLRLGENSSLRLITNRLIDTRVEILAGSAVVEVDEIAKDTNVTVVAAGTPVTFSRAGLYRFDMEPPQVKVFKGAVNVQASGEATIVPKGRLLSLGGETASTEKFETEDTDSLDNWSQRRSEYVAMANVSSARYANNSGYGPSYGYSGGYAGSSMWAWNPYFGMYTFLPMTGLAWSPYGYAFWSPVAVPYMVFSAPRPSGNRGGRSLGSVGVSHPAPALSSGEFSRNPGTASMGSAAPVSSMPSAGAAAPSVSHGGAAGGVAGSHR